MSIDTSDIPAPGYFIREELEARRWTQRDLAYVLGVKEQRLNKLLSGKYSVGAEMAAKLGAAFDVAPEFFLNLQNAYDLSRAPEPDPSVARKAALQSRLPVREMIRRGWLIADAAPDLLEAQMVKFFELSSVGDLLNLREPAHAAKRTRYDDRTTDAQIAWLHRVRQLARDLHAPKYSAAALRAAMPRLKSLMVAPEEARNVPRILMECGVRFVLVEGLPSEKIDGVCTWLDDSAPVVGMSTRRDRIDNFWFVLRHELEHVLSGHGRDVVRVDAELDEDAADARDSLSDEERLADAAAAAFCIPPKDVEVFIARKAPYISERDVLGLAARLGVHPGIVAGQVRKRLNRWNIFTRHLVKIRHAVSQAAVVDGWGTIAPACI